MFGDNSEKYVEKFAELLEDQSIESILEQNDLLPEEALYNLFITGYIKNPFNDND